MNCHSFTFQKARPVWEAGTETQMNRTLTLACTLSGKDGYKLSVAANSLYLLTVNGNFAFFGPARAAHGFYRVDEIDLSPYLSDGENTVALRVCGYNVNSFSYVDMPSFVCAEIAKGDHVVAYTDLPLVGFRAYLCTERVQKTHRFSFQRCFSEAYFLEKGAFDTEKGHAGQPAELCLTEEKNFLYRDIPYGDFDRLYPVKTLQYGKLTYGSSFIYNDRSLRNIPTFRTYPREELDYDPAAIVATFEYHHCDVIDLPVNDLTVAADGYLDLDLGKNQTGIMEFDIETEGGELFVQFDEILVDGQINWHRVGDTTNFISVKAKAGNYHLVATEPNVMRYIRICAKGGCFTLKNFVLHKVAFPESVITAKFVGNDPVMEKIYEAAKETFAANAADIYMDCPSRERAGWLCDSFFTSRVEKVLTGKSLVERAFLQNFLLPEKFDHIPEGMLPMCYPADHTDHVFIPNWAMWYVCELEEYVERTGDRELMNDAKDRVYGLLNYFRRFENSNGLLEKLESWVFVEWSKANELTQDVNFPSNMLYSKFKTAIANLYSDKGLAEEAAALRAKIRELSFTGTFFCDNAYRKEKGLELSGICTEVCQYYAFFCDVATPETNPMLWEILVKDFGYDRKETGKYPEIPFANAFIGNYLRLDLLDRYGYETALIDNIRGYFEGMANRTGTLWEHDDTRASCNHGFASHVIYWMAKHGLVE